MFSMVLRVSIRDWDSILLLPSSTSSEAVPEHTHTQNRQKEREGGGEREGGRERGRERGRGGREEREGGGIEGGR